MNDYGEIPLSDSEFERIRGRVYEQAGIALSDAKRTLVVARLAKIVRLMRLGSFGRYLDYLEAEGTADDAQAFINALTTNLTRFYREEHHFSHLVTYVGTVITEKLRDHSAKRLRIWSAGCSTGQEPYTIAVALLAAYPELKDWDFKILATDIDTVVLERARGGVYPASEINGLTPEQAQPFGRLDDGRIKVPDAAMALVSFKPLNLLSLWPMKGPFDAVFCRNVTIYFDKPTQTKVFEGFARILVPNGVLYIGHSENMSSGHGAFRPVGRTVYQVRPARTDRDAA